MQDNIAALADTAANVIVFRQSAGGGSVAALLTMPTGSGLFQSAIT
ncbi:hypothetical protein [Mycobacterium deserti]|nr:hypothetical protein [Mycobacterium deserti]